MSTLEQPLSNPREIEVLTWRESPVVLSVPTALPCPCRTFLLFSELSICSSVVEVGISVSRGVRKVQSFTFPALHFVAISNHASN